MTHDMVKKLLETLASRARYYNMAKDTEDESYVEGILEGCKSSLLAINIIASFNFGDGLSKNKIATITLIIDGKEYSRSVSLKKKIK